MSGRATRARRLAGAVSLGMILFGVVSLDTGSAAFVETTTNSANSASSHAVFPPKAVSATVTLNTVPLLTCRAVVTWNPSSTNGVDSYEVRRILASTGVVAGGPWVVPAPAPGLPGSYEDDPVPLLGAGLGLYAWQVRAVTAGGLSSDWATAAAPNSVLCS